MPRPGQQLTHALGAVLFALIHGLLHRSASGWGAGCGACRASLPATSGPGQRRVRLFFRQAPPAVGAPTWRLPCRMHTLGFSVPAHS